MKRYSIVNQTDAGISGVAALRREFATLEKRANKNFDSFDDFLWPAHIALTIIATLVVGVTTLDLFTAFIVLLSYGVFPGPYVSFFFAAILLWLFRRSIEQFWTKRRLKSKWYARYTFLKSEIERIEQQAATEKLVMLAEEKRLAAEKEEYERRMFASTYELLDRLRPFHDGTHKELFQIIRFFSRKSRWYDKYRIYEERLGQIIDRAEITTSELDDHPRHVSELPEKLRLSFGVFRALVAQQISRSERLLGDFEAMKDWTPSVTATRRSTTNARTGNTRPRLGVARISRPTIAQSEDSSENYDFSQPATILQPVVVAPPPPPKRRVLNKQLKKIPFEDYVGAAKSKMEIGELGEIIVLHYEIRRVAEETGHIGTGHVRRVSEESDSYGYDLESFSQGENVFIEVKSTTGTFWTDFFLSANEQKVMKKLGEKYWLYRIFEMSKDDGSAKLSVFRGKSEIDASFDLEATNYKMNPKATADGTLPFETLE